MCHVPRDQLCGELVGTHDGPIFLLVVGNGFLYNSLQLQDPITQATPALGETIKYADDTIYYY